MPTALQNLGNLHRPTGPTSDAGKAISCQNATKDNIWGEKPVGKGESLTAYQQRVNDYQAETNPKGVRQHLLSRTMARLDFKLERFDRVQDILENRYIAQSGKDPDEALADLYTDIKKHPQFKYLETRRAQAQNQWFRAQSELRRLQKSQSDTDDLLDSLTEAEFVPNTKETQPQTPRCHPVPDPDNVR